MTLLSAISFIFFNIAFGLSGILMIKVFLFHPSKEWYLFGIKIPFTPGYLFKKKQYIHKKIHELLVKLEYECNNYSSNSSFSKLESQIFRHIYTKMENLEQIDFIPTFLIRLIKRMTAQFCFEVSRQFLRSFLPFLIKEYKVENYVELISKNISVFVLRDYYVKYIHRYLIYINLIIFFLLGFYNMIVFLLVR